MKKYTITDGELSSVIELAIGAAELRKEVEMLREQLEKAEAHSQPYYQLCPKCHGQGTVSKPPWVAGDIQSWIGSESSYVCDLCNGTKTLFVK